jgi:hypothetical protein
MLPSTSLTTVNLPKTRYIGGPGDGAVGDGGQAVAIWVRLDQLTGAVTMSRWPALMTQAQASRRSPRTGASTSMV